MIITGPILVVLGVKTAIVGWYLYTKTEAYKTKLKSLEDIVVAKDIKSKAIAIDLIMVSFMQTMSFAIKNKSMQKHIEKDILNTAELEKIKISNYSLEELVYKICYFFTGDLYQPSIKSELFNSFSSMLSLFKDKKVIKGELLYVFILMLKQNIKKYNIKNLEIVKLSAILSEESYIIHKGNSLSGRFIPINLTDKQNIIWNKILTALRVNFSMDRAVLFKGPSNNELPRILDFLKDKKIKHKPNITIEYPGFV